MLPTSISDRILSNVNQYLKKIRTHTHIHTRIIGARVPGMLCYSRNKPILNGIHIVQMRMILLIASVFDIFMAVREHVVNRVKGKTDDPTDDANYFGFFIVKKKQKT